MQILLTGFGPFGEVMTNPSQLIVEAIAGDASGFRQPIRPAILPVDFATAGAAVRALIEDTRPNLILMLGVAAKRENIGLERIALNLDDSARPDNAGNAPDGVPIDPAGPLALAATLPLAELKQALVAREIPAAISNHAGAYLCNHAFYTALWTVARLGLDVRCGFIHVPMPRELQPDDAGVPFALADLVSAVRYCLAFLSEDGAHADEP